MTADRRQGPSFDTKGQMNTRKRKTKPRREQAFVWSGLVWLGRGIGRLFGWRPQTKTGLLPLTAHWQQIVLLWHSRDAHQLQTGLFEADKLLDEALKTLGAPGVTLGERLKAGRFCFSSDVGYQAAWEGHKLRNRLAHELSSVTPGELSQGLQDYLIAFRELGVAI